MSDDADVLAEHRAMLRKSFPDTDEHLVLDTLPLGLAVARITMKRLLPEFDTTCEVSPFVASRFTDLAVRGFVYDGKRHTLVGSWQEASGQPVTLMFKTEPV